MAKKSDLYQYLLWRGDIPFKEVKLNEVDSIILSEISYFEMYDKVPLYPTKESVEYSKAIDDVFKDHPKKKIKTGLIVPYEIVTLVDEVRKQPRFGLMKATNYINHISTKKRIQFSAITFILDDGSIYVSFRGTDDSLIGWQENLDMLTTFPVPAQEEARKYLNKVARLFPKGDIYVGGQSKGGALSFYAGMYSDEKVKKRIKRIDSFDGPGFTPGKIDMEVFNKVKDRMHKYIPQTCIVGLMLDNLPLENTVVHSTARGVFQHNPLSYEIVGGKFIIHPSGLDNNALLIKKKFDELVSRLTPEERDQLCEDFFHFIEMKNINTLTEASKKSIFTLAKDAKFKQGKVFVELFFYIITHGGI